MADKLDTDSIEVALAQIAWELTPATGWFSKKDQGGHIDDYKRQAEYFAATFAGLLAIKTSTSLADEPLTKEQIASAFKW